MAKIRGFTIVELLIVIVVIGILAALAFSAYVGAQDRAREAKMKSDLSALSKAVEVARLSSNQTLMQITGDDWTWGHCNQEGAGITDPSKTLPKTHDCWVNYYQTLDAIAQASGNNGILDLKKGDPWGNVYIIDENEGADVGNPCIADWLASTGKNFESEDDDYEIHTTFSLTIC